MKALTIWQPWANAIAHHGKRIENRTWPPPKSIIGERIAIHAGKKVDKDAVTMLGVEPVPTGAIIATAVVLGWTNGLPESHSQHRWFCGPCGWVLDQIRPLANPEPCRGAQGLWDVPPEVAARIHL